MKRILLLFSALMLSCIALWAHDVEIGGIYYNLDETNKTAGVTYRGGDYDDYDEYSGSVTIPETITYNSQTYSVTSIGQYAFRDCSGLTSVTIPNSVTYIGSDAFYNTGIYNNNSNWDNGVLYIDNCLIKAKSDIVKGSYTIKKGTRFIGSYAFYNCSGLTSVTIPNSVTSIGKSAFEDCSGLTSVTIPNSVTSIGSYAFEDCSGLTEILVLSNNEEFSSENGVLYNKDKTTLIRYPEGKKDTSFTIPTSVTSIGSFAFDGCRGLTSVTIPNSVTNIGHCAFYGCSGLTKVNYLGTVDKWVDFDFDVDASNPTCYAKYLYINNELLTDVKITTADSIKIFAFYNCRSIKSVEIGESVTSIGDYAFTACNGLTEVTIPNSVTSIGKSAFESCSRLTSVTIPNSVTSIGYEAFRYCSGLTSVTIPNSVTYIGDYAFEYCSRLTKVTIPNSVTSIGKKAFIYCSGLTSVIWNAKNCEDFGTESSPFYNIRSSITSFTFGNEVEHIPAYLCYGMSKLTEMTIPNSVTSIGNWTFSDCNGLTSVTIPNSVTSIGNWTFSDCSGLTSVTIPNNVTSIGYNAFEDCSGLTSVIWNAKNYADFEAYDETPFYNIRSSITSFTFGNEVEHIPAYLCYDMENLKEVTIGNSVTSIGYDAFYNCSGLTSVIWNAKNCKDFSSSTYSPFYDISSSITSFTIGNEVEHIPALLCNWMSKLSEVTIPNSVTSIGSSAFNSCSGLTKVNYLGTVDKWVEIDFKNSNSNPTNYAKDLYINNKLLTDVKITTADSIKKYAFYNCQSIKSVEIGESVTSIGSSAFSGCSGLTSVIWNAKNCEDFSSSTYSPFYDIRSNITSFTFGNEVEHIHAYLCYGMSKLTEITIPNSVTSIGDWAFNNCSGLTSITIPNSVTSIGQYAFKSCSGLTSVIWNAKNYKDCSSSTYSPFYDIRSSLTSFTFGNEVEHIPAYLCYGMSKLTEITIPNSVTSIGSDAFSGCSGLTSVTIPNSVTSIGYSAFYDCSGLTKVNYLVTVDKWVEIDFEDSRSNPTYYAKDLYINNELLTDVKITTADSIKNYAFYNCQSIKSVEIGESVTSIGSSAFSGCDKLRKVTAYPTTVPNVYENSFAHYNAALYVPCDVYDDYFFDEVWGTFKVTDCIAAEEVDAPEKVEIEVDEDNNANVIWPSTDGAKKYELEISKDGEVFCTLLFNENGQLTSIDFGNRSASVGFQFTVTGLDGASKYAYSMIAMDKKGNELQSYKGTFTTNGYVPGPGEEDEPVSITETLADANITVSGGTISADADFSIYNTIGQNVTAFNGSLQPGIYVVALGEDRVKIMIQ